LEQFAVTLASREKGPQACTSYFSSRQPILDFFSSDTQKLLAEIEEDEKGLDPPTITPDYYPYAEGVSDACYQDAMSAPESIRSDGMEVISFLFIAEWSSFWDLVSVPVVFGKSWKPIIYDVFGNPFRPVPFDPSWLTSAVVSLARTMHDSRDFSAMPILADALQDAGCDHPDVLAHCRSDGPHVRGCWVVDLVLGKT
jgi:hypothetical protein